MPPDSSPKIMTGKIQRVDPKTLIADVFVMEIGAIITGVNLCFPNKGVDHGCLTVPNVGSSVLVTKASDNKFYILSSANVGAQITPDASSSTIEALLPGENLIQSQGRAFLKQDTLGNSSLFGRFGNGLVLDRDGVNYSFGLGEVKETLIKKSISGIGLDLSSYAVSGALNKDILKLIDREEYFSEVQIKKAFVRTEISVNGSINNTIKAQIMNDAVDIANKISGYTANVNGVVSFVPGFRQHVADLRDTLSQVGINSSEYHLALTQFWDSISDRFNSKKSGVKIVIDKGHTTNSKIRNMNDVMSLKDTDFINNDDGDSICWKMSLVDVATNEEKAFITIDKNGHCHVKFASITIDGLVPQGGL